jgi:hypothetical protein
MVRFLLVYFFAVVRKANKMCPLDAWRGGLGQLDARNEPDQSRHPSETGRRGARRVMPHSLHNV